MKLKRLKIHKYRIIEPGTELTFGDGFNLVIGRNGTGKTTLLNLLAMVFGGNFSHVSKEDFDLEYDFEDAEGSLRVVIRNQADIGPFGPAHPDGTSRYTIGMNFRSTGEHHTDDFRLEAGNASTVIKYEDAREVRWDIPLSPFSEGGNFMNFVFKSQPSKQPKDASIPQRLKFPRGFERFDESTEFFRRILEKAHLRLKPDYKEHTQPYDYRVSRPVLSPVEISRRIIERLQGKEVPTISIPSSELLFLDRTVHALGYREASMMVDLTRSSYLSVDQYPADYPVHLPVLYYGNFRFHFVKRDGSRISHEQLSFGEKRLLAFHYYLDTYAHVLLADELANGMHHDMVDQCLDAAGDRQAFLATQNPLLLDHMGFSSAEQVKLSFVLCRCEMKHDREYMVFTHMTDEQSAEFFADYKIGIQHVNEVLRMRGLW
jgi:hypothetical protein